MTAPGLDFKVALVMADGSQRLCVVLGSAGWVQAMDWAEQVVPDGMAVGAICLRPPAAHEQKGGA